MKSILLFVTLLAIAIPLAAQDPRPVVYPEDLTRGMLTETAFTPSLVPSQQEFLEVSAPAYPGLKLDLPELNDRFTYQRRTFPFPTHSPDYCANGGMMLAYWGFPMVTGEVFSTDILSPGK